MPQFIVHIQSNCRVFCLIIGLVMLNYLFANNNYWSYKNYTNEDGLSHNYILSVTQDSLGFLWIATIDGLNRFDGTKFKKYRNIRNDSTSISSNVLHTLYVDSNGDLWIGTFNKGLCRYNFQHDNFIQYTYNSDSLGTSDGRIYGIDEDNEGNLWIATFDGGLNKYVRKTNSFKYYQYDSLNANSIQGNTLLSVHVDKDGKVWSGVKFKGLSCYNPKEDKFYNYVLKTNEKQSGGYIPEITSYSDGSIWLASESGIIKLLFDNNELVYRENYVIDNSSLISKVVNSFVDYDEHHLILGYGSNGGYLFDKKTNAFIPCIDIEENNKNYITFSVTISDDNSVWFGTKDKGLFHYQPLKSQFNLVRNIPEIASSLSESSVLSIFEEEQGNIWIGTNNGLNFRESTKPFKSLEGFKHLHFLNPPDNLQGINIIYAILKDSYGIFWLGTQAGIIAVNQHEIYNSKNIQQQWLTNTAKVNPRAVTWTISEDKLGNIWLGTERGLYRLYNRNGSNFPQSIKNYKHIPNDPKSIPSVRIRNTYTDSQGHLWVCTYKGLSLYKGNDEFETYSQELPTRSALLDGNDLYMGTIGEGLYYRNLSNNSNNKIQIVKTLGQSTIWSILKDKRNNLWLSTNNGIVKYNPQTGEKTRFYSEHGLQNNEFISGSYFKGKSGRFYFGGVNGYNVFYPDSIKTDYVKPKIYITGLRIFNQRVQPGDTIEGRVVQKENIITSDEIFLNYTHKIITLEFSAIEFNVPRAIRYKYRLVGLNNNWIELDHKTRSVSFTNLKKGNYNFQVYAFNNHNQKSDVASLKINVIPPFWDRLLFYALLISVLIIVFLLAIKQRVYKSKKEKARLQYERDLMQKLMDNIPDKIYFKDTKSRFTRVNQSLATEVGELYPDMLIGKTDFDYFSHKFASETYGDEQSIISTGISQINKEENHTDSKGKNVWYAATKVPLYDNQNRIVGIVGISRDITPQKEHEIELSQARTKAEESEKLKTAFLANMSHEVRTPMNAILGFLGLIKNEVPRNDELDHYFEIVDKNGHLLLNLVNDIIDISMIDANQVVFESEDFSVNELLRSLFLEYKHKSSAHPDAHFSFKLNIEFNDEVIVKSDQYRINQIIKNFLENAFKFTHSGYIEIGARLKNNEVEVYISDTGIGIPGDKLNDIFNRFTKVEEHASELYRGTGLGLFICKRLSDSLGLNISVDSEINKGSTFKINIPDAKLIKSEKPMNKEIVNKSTQSYDWSMYTVLIVEDEISNFEILKIFLKYSGINIVHAGNGEDAIRLYSQAKIFNIILMDIKIPKIGGIEVIKFIREQDKQVPIIAQTAYAMKHEIEKIMAAGCDDYITKPINPDILREKMNTYLIRRGN